MFVGLYRGGGIAVISRDARLLKCVKLAASAAAAGAQVALTENNVRLLDATVASTPTSPIDRMPCLHQASAANHIAGRALLQAHQPFLSVT